MRIKGLAVIALALSVQACGRPVTSLYADKVASRSSEPADVSAAPNYVGRWAVSAGACAKPWTLTKDRLTAPTGTACDIVGANPTVGGYTASSLCTLPGEGARAKSGRLVMTLTGAASEQAMTLSDAPFQSVSLVRCAT